MTFAELGLNDELLNAISYMGFEKASPIQEQSIPEILTGQDIIACAQTGTGKTAAFLLPILHMIQQNKLKGTSTLILAPTRELAMQIDQQIQGIAYFLGIESIAIYGGGDGKGWDLEKKAITAGSDIIVATPGKLIAHMNMGYVPLKDLKYLVFDEADRMLDMGFINDILKIYKALPAKKQTILFSATMPPKIRSFAKQILAFPKEISISISKPAKGVSQKAFATFDQQKTKLVNTLLHERDNYHSILIFTSKKARVSKILSSLDKSLGEIKGISSDFDQKEREEVLLRFRSKQTKILVTTDVLSRGIDIKDINLVINFDVPNDAEDYVHRIGRTARAETKGEAITFVNEEDMKKIFRIEKLMGMEIPKFENPEAIGIGPEWKEGKNFSKGKKPHWKNKKKRPNN